MATPFKSQLFTFIRKIRYFGYSGRSRMLNTLMQFLFLDTRAITFKRDYVSVSFLGIRWLAILFMCNGSVVNF